MQYIALISMFVVASVVSTPASSPKGASTNSRPVTHSKPQKINRRCFGRLGGCGGCGGCGGFGGLGSGFW